MPDAIRVVGLRDLERAFLLADRTVRSDLKDAVEEAAQPVRRDAQRLAGTEISHMGVDAPWAQMRVGSARSVAYVAPVERGVKTKGRERLRRPNLARRLLEDAMEPALEHNREAVVRRMEGLLDEVADVWEHA